jgi:hypothetical protein
MSKKTKVNESTAIVARPMTHHETIQIQRPHNFVEPWRDDAPIERRQPTAVADPYAQYLPQTVQQVVRYEVTPESRGRALAIKTHQVTIFLAILTLAGMVMLSQWSFWLWLVIASAEWIGTFVFLAILDYREQPQSLARMTADRYLRMMEREQGARLRAQYGDDER